MTEAIEAEYEALLTFVYLCPVGVVQVGANGAVSMMNPHAAQLLLPITRSPSGIFNLFEALEGCAPELRNMAEAFDAERGHICQGHRIRISLNARGPRVLSCSLLKVSADCLIAVLHDVTREVELERQIKQSEAMYAALVAGINDFALFSLDKHGRIDTWNSSGARQTGFVAADVIGRDLAALCHGGNAPDQTAELIAAATREGWSLSEARCFRRNGTRYWCQILVSATEGPDGTVSGYSVVMRDVMERRLNADELRRLLTTDHLTGATNRARFFELAEVEMVRHARGAQPLSAIMIDVDHFKRINDTFGHAIGDALLRSLVGCCRACLREGDTLARLGGEEFAVLMPDTDLSSAALVAERMREAVAAELASLSGVIVDVTISLGCAEMTPDYDGFDALLHAADGALYRAKHSGRNKVLTTAASQAAGELAVA